MKKTIGALVVLILAVPVLVQATPGILKAFLEKYPGAAKTQLVDCRVCHLPVNDDFLNPYGQGLHEARLDFAALEGADSDGDGTGNLDEIRAGSLPGSQAGPDEVFVFTNRMGNITFDHQGHSLAPRYKIAGDCNLCHGPEGFPRLFVDTGDTWQKIAHVVCKGCHKQSNSEKAPTRCRECHVKKGSENEE